MYNNMELTHKNIKQYVNDKLVYQVKHNTLPLTIYRYSKYATYQDSWDELLLSCRGLILDDKDNIVARPYKKFFNYNQQRHIESNDFDVFEKVDGFQGILFNYNNQWIMASAGSFHSDYSDLGQRIFDSKMNGDYTILKKDYTYVFDIVSTKAKIVIDYTEDDIILHGIINNKTGEELNIYSPELVDKFTVVKKYEFDNLNDVINCQWENFEGFVIRFKLDDGTYSRCKFKMDEYCRKHILKSQLNNYTIFEHLKSGKSIEEFIDENNLEDEFHEFIKKTSHEIRLDYYSLYNNIFTTYEVLLMNLKFNYTRKDMVDKIMNNSKYKKYFKYLMLIEDRNHVNLNNLIWDEVKPKKYQVAIYENHENLKQN